MPPSFAFRNSQSRAFPRGFMPVGSLLYVFPRTPGTVEQGTHRSVECVCSLVCYTVAFLRVLHAPCIPCAFPVSSLAFPDRPAIRFRLCSPVSSRWVPSYIPLASCCGFSHASFRSCISTQRINHKATTPQLYKLQMNPILTSPFVAPVSVCICSNAFASAVGFTRLSP